MQGTSKGVMYWLVPCSIQQIGSYKCHTMTDGWTFSLELSFLEIYNECLRDLLRDTRKDECKHKIKVSSDGRRAITNLTVKSVDSSDHTTVNMVLALGAKHRAATSTNMNAKSSRSHSILTLNMIAKHEERNQVVRGTLNLVDLAGSERLDRSNAEGQQAKETVAINTSLGSLADVFHSIRHK